MRDSCKSIACALLAVAFVLMAAVKFLSPHAVRAQDEPEQVAPFDDCVRMIDSTDSDDIQYYEVRNDCGVKIHAQWGPYDSDTGRGTMMYSADLDPDETAGRMMNSYGHYYSLGCPATGEPGHPYGYKLTYKDAIGRTVTSFDDLDDLVCALW
jgi:hypothetical protein